MVSTSSQKTGVTLLVGGIAAALSAWLVVVTDFRPLYFERAADEEAYGPPAPIFQLIDYADLPHWSRDALEEALPVFLRSCAQMLAAPTEALVNTLENLGPPYDAATLAGVVADWAPACAAAAALNPRDYANANAWRAGVRAYFESYFRPIKVLQERRALPADGNRGAPPLIEEAGVFTGYFEPRYEARRSPEGRFTEPAYARPSDLVDVDLGSFNPELAGARIAGRLQSARLVPYAERAEIERGEWSAQPEVLAYLDPNDLFFLQIQGSGSVVFEDGEVKRIGYAGANGRPYAAIGRLLVERGEMALADASMQSIRTWLAAAGASEAEALRHENPSYIFFRELDAPPAGLGPPGAQGVPLTPERSLAVDRRYYPMGAPVYVDIGPRDGIDEEPIRRLMIAQDTGGAIRGPIRGDVYWGSGEEAGARAGEMNNRGALYYLAPRTITDALEAQLKAAS